MPKQNNNTLFNNWENVVSPVRNNIVFEDRNKAYGAYDLPINHNKTIALALLFTVTILTLLIGFPKIMELFSKKIEGVKSTPVELTNIVDFTTQPPSDKIEQPPSTPFSPIKEAVKFILSNEFDQKAVDESIPEQQTDNLSEPSPAIQATEDTNIPKKGENGVVGQDEDKPLTVVDQMPEFPGGEKELYTFLSSNIKYPQNEYAKGIKGTSFVTFVVEKDGSITNVKIVKGVNGSPGCDNEAMRVIRLMPK